MKLDPDLAFQLSSTLALLGWVALALSPASARWSRGVWRIVGRLLPLALAVVYVVLLVGPKPAGGGFGSIDEVQALFSSRRALAAGWVHYLAFDLFVGVWIAERAAALKLPHWQVLPLLLLTFLFGPVGYLSFIALRAWRRPQSLRWRAAGVAAAAAAPGASA